MVEKDRNRQMQNRQIGVEKGPPYLKPVTHVLSDESWHSYTLPKEDPKNMKIT